MNHNSDSEALTSPTIEPKIDPPKEDVKSVVTKIKEAESLRDCSARLVEDYDIPDIVELENGLSFAHLPSAQFEDLEALSNPISANLEEVTPVKILGTAYMMGTRKVRPTNSISNTPVSFRKLKNLVYMDKGPRDKFLEAWLKKHNRSDFSLNIFHVLNSTENSTQRAYFRKLIELEEFFFAQFPEKVHNLDFSQIILLPCLKRMIISFLHAKSKGGVALNTLQSYVVAVNFARKLLGLGMVPGKVEISNALKALGRLRCKRPKGTSAIPVCQLRRFFQFLKRKGVRTYIFFTLSFWAGSRASEAANIQVKSFFFFRTPSGRPAVKLIFLRPKTKKKYMDDRHIVIFSQSPDQFTLCPYKMSVWFCQNFSDETFLLPFEASSKAARQTRLYSWFRKLKGEFESWHYSKFSETVLTGSWTFHSFRTTLIAVLRNAGLPWEKIQLRVGHKLDSNTTKEIYYMNALLTDGFDKDFDKILEKNEEISSLVDKKSSLPDLSQSEIPTKISPTQIPQQKDQKNKKRDRRFMNFRKRNQSQAIIVRHHKLTRQTSATEAYKNLRRKYFG